MILNTKIRSIIHFVVLFIIGFTIYSNVLNGEFVSDDYITIVENPAIRQIASLSEIFQKFNTRFLVGLTFAINYQIGEMDTFSYHVVNILVHIFVSFLVFKCVLIIFETPYLENHSTYLKRESIAILASLIFLCHPIQTQGVAFITQRAASMGTGLYLLTLYFYIKARLSSNWQMALLAFMCFIIGTVTKEIIITIPATILVFDFFFFDKDKRDVLVKFLALLIIGIYGWLLIVFLDRSDSVLYLKNKMVYGYFDWKYFVTEINVLRTYLRLLVLPINQTHVYSYILSPSTWAIWTLYSICLLAGLLYCAKQVFYRNRLVSFCILWFFITTSVEAVVVCFVHKAVIFEHWLYLPMFGFSLLLSILLHEFIKNTGRRMVCSILILCILCVMTFQRNKVWQTEIGFWEDNVSKSPNDVGTNMALALAYANKENVAGAIKYNKKALEIDPKFGAALNNLGIMYANLERDDLALKYFQRLHLINPFDQKILNNIAFLHFTRQEYKKSQFYYEKAISIKNNVPEMYFYLAQCLYKQNQLIKAKDNFNQALELYQKYNYQDKVEEIHKILKEM